MLPLLKLKNFVLNNANFYKLHQDDFEKHLNDFFGKIKNVLYRSSLK